IPPDNPFPSGNALGARAEIWAFGLRNPWHFSFDDPSLGGTGAMLIGDVGQNMGEEVNYQPPGIGGLNYGWRVREGAHPNPNLPPETPAYTPLTDPILEYPHPDGSSITGGVVYRGRAMHAAYRRRYFFADLGGRIWSVLLAPAAGGGVTPTGLVEHTDELGGLARIGFITAIGANVRGDIYFVSYFSGTVMKLVDPTGPAVPR